MVEGYFHGACVNCHYGNGGSKCTFRPGKSRSIPIAILREHSVLMRAILLDAQIRTKKSKKSIMAPLHQASPVPKVSSRSQPASSGSRRSASGDKPPSKRVVRRVLNYLLNTLSGKFYHVVIGFARSLTHSFRFGRR